eukprot:gnl/TRDRNA2_/TRDRNA2_151158_c1_seq1.p1 gnl/TRDRNA2_/TRDRNA2_151158_c1~~gnl/TRDRNA2_/TRDRNA2_151158_c1_seq1.p1  ORF type:complete len:706 (+),score=97.68 gnl/TRDRNA2_/TRDRNA2_151158_c1_seq1:210-2120(+)
MFVDGQFPPTQESLFKSPNPAADHAQDVVNATSGGNVRWARAREICHHGRLFNHVHPNDIAQGVLGDCWLLAGLAALAEFEGAIFNLFEEKCATADGKYTFRIYNVNTRQWESEVIDDFLPVKVEDGQPIMAKPQGNEMWVLLAEKAVAKWFGSYVQINGAFCMTPFLILTDVGQCKSFSQARGPGGFDSNQYEVKNITLADAHNRNSIQLQPAGPNCLAQQLWHEILQADRMNYVMAAWTQKDPATQAGVGASGEHIGADGIVKGHAYSLIHVYELTADNRLWKVVQLRNPWGANPAAEWKGNLSDNWPLWGQFPELYQKLGMGDAALDGQFWMTWDDFRDRFSDLGVAPKSMEVPKMGDIEAQGMHHTGSGKHGKSFVKRRGPPTAVAAVPQPVTYVSAPMMSHTPSVPSATPAVQYVSQPSYQPAPVAYTQPAAQPAYAPSYQPAPPISYSAHSGAYTVPTPSVSYSAPVAYAAPPAPSAASVSYQPAAPSATPGVPSYQPAQSASYTALGSATPAVPSYGSATPAVPSYGSATPALPSYQPAPAYQPAPGYQQPPSYQTPAPMPQAAPSYQPAPSLNFVPQQYSAVPPPTVPPLTGQQPILGGPPMLGGISTPSMPFPGQAFGAPLIFPPPA